MNSNTLPLAQEKKGSSCNIESLLEANQNLKLAGNATMPPKISIDTDPFGLKTNAFNGNSSFVQRQSSILSFQNLSVGDCTSINDSQYSHYNPSINEPFVSEDADPDEKEMHQFLDLAGVFQVNIKQ